MNAARRRASTFALILAGAAVPLAPGCGDENTASQGAGGGTPTGSGGAPTGSGGSGGSGGEAPCSTRITYGDTWMHGADHPDPFDDTVGPVTWDGTCTDDGPNSFAVLSNGWKPYFEGNSACVIAIDTTCPGAPACTTRISYGPSWIPAPNHPAYYDDVVGRVFWDRACANEGADSFASLSNGWVPHFAGLNACALSFKYEGCGGLYQNPVVPGGCADPGVIFDGNQYVAACTSGEGLGGPLCRFFWRSPTPSGGPRG